MPVPPQVPVIHFSSPAFGDLTLTELWNTEVASYIELPYGSRHPNTDKWSGYILVKQQPLDGDEKWVMRWWVADPVVENTYNLAKEEYGGENIAIPIFTRQYLIRRTEYIQGNLPARGSALTGVIAIRVTAGGSGYDSTTTVALSNGGGAGATASAIVFRGVVVGIYVTEEGSGYTSVPDVAINGTGAGATAVARIQPASAKLVREWAERIEDQPEDGLYLKITRIYETLPGATLTSKKVGELGAIETTTTQRVTAGSVTPAGGYLVQGDATKAESTVIDVHERTLIAEWPQLTDYELHPQYGVLIVTTFKIEDVSLIPDPALEFEVGKVKRIKHIDKFRSMKIIEDYTALLGIVDSTPLLEYRFMAHNFPRLFDVLEYAYSDECGAFSNQRDSFSAMVPALTETFFTDTVVPATGLTIQPKSLFLGKGLNITDALLNAGSFTYAGSCTGTISFSASDPSYSDYINIYQNTFQLITAESVLTEFGGIYKNTLLYVLML